MKIKKGYVLRVLKDQNIVVTIGQARSEFHGMIRLNETGRFLWEQLQEDKSEEELIQAMTGTYDIDADTAKQGINKFLQMLDKVNCIEK